MKAYSVNELRKMFLEFFESKEHLMMKSSSLVPHNDNSLLLINSGMAPLKPYFTGQEIPPKRRVTTCQKCIRTGDIENIGKTARHGTFFEMLGNFSFGDYFKSEAIHWAWEFLTEVVGIDPDRLYPSIYVDDDDAFRIWNEEMNIPAERIYRFGKEDNFWEHGAGPCGPCSEIYYDRGEKWGNGPEDVMGGEGDRFMEVWNIVFSQFNNDGKGNYTDLIQKNIDTGMGLERLAVVCQDVASLFDVDTNRAMMRAIEEIAHCKYEEDPVKDVSLRIIADHVKSCTFMASDGIMPSNEGRGYVFRRLLRRAARHGRLLGIEGKFLADLAKVAIDQSKDGYPELEEKSNMILSVFSKEEDSFNRTIDQGLSILADMEEQMAKEGSKVLAGENAFKLYDTFGFPLDLTKEILEEKGLEVDEEGFKKCMQIQRETARGARKTSNYNGREATVYDQIDPDITSEFDGYDKLELESKISVLTTEEEVVEALTDGQIGTIITDVTPFYGTMGGQQADQGIIESANGKFVVEDTIHLLGGKIGHVGRVVSGMFTVGDAVVLKVDAENRADTCRNHSATHLLQQALRTVLGTHVEQAGSMEDAKRLRFDFTHFAAMSPSELAAVEDLVNQKIREDLPVQTDIMSLEEARKTGAMALFGEKYGNEVRVVRMGDFSTELCGGTHVSRTGDIRAFKIMSESGISAGVRRIEALTADNLMEHYAALEEKLMETCRTLKTTPAALESRVDALLEEVKALHTENEKLKARLANDSVKDAADSAVDVAGVKVLTLAVKDVDMNGLRNLGDQMKEKLGTSIVVIASEADGKVNLIAAATDDAIKAGAHAGNLLKAIAPKVQGGGGGRPNMAQAGGKNPAGIPEALTLALETAKAQLGA